MKVISTSSLKNSNVDLLLCCVDNFEARIAVNRVSYFILIFKFYSIIKMKNKHLRLVMN